MVKPVLKWAGGKRQLLEEIIKLFPNGYEKKRLHEPMVGGGAVTFEIEPNKGTINDVNGRLTRFYEVIRDKPEELIEENRSHRYNEDYYYSARKEFNKPIRNEDLDKVREASLLLYLNRTCFNGLYRENSKGEFNVPFGDYNNPDYVKAEQIRNCSQVLKNLKIENNDFEYILDEAKKGDLVYFDPPYQPVSETANFTEYSKEGFELKDQKRLFNTCIKLDKKETYFILSNSWAKPIRKLYEKQKNFEVIKVKANRDINSKAKNRKPVSEILATNIPKDLRIGKKQKALKKFLKD
ncbi:MAG: Site-specific DNA methylase Dam [Candidatus Methanohalarchaeum thermophilum]|uniref:site-specific DNA-methyltransferase (adenine-specific) n=1 Tax=Methanohalarchaeum thermophilum TaxID=1903181 RepID=A0A1Q6DS04_METT1|nr:MAG: Site-specific DNA methylase Dam [Candidatus Methanohalarchaeum thermophilum]